MDVPYGARPIAVFDSGLGGLTVVRELRRRFPHETLVYFGDTARVPYGSKSAATVTRFTLENCAFLRRFDPKCIVAACNTASALAVPQIADGLDTPLIGVVEPGAQAAVAACQDGGLIAVIATEATVASNEYRHAISRIKPSVPVVQKACPLFVPMVEEGRTPEDRLVRLAVSEYLEPLRRLAPSVVVLGCTHYPLLRPAIAAFFGEGVAIVDSAAATAYTAEQLLEGEPAPERDARGALLCYVSDNPQRFQSIGSRFLGEPITDVVRVCPEELYAATELLRGREPLHV
ncbi:MAG TPA: glutamate racemase [Phycisphaerae bacterium]|jgi:glutamate racemase